MIAGQKIGGNAGHFLPHGSATGSDHLDGMCFERPIYNVEDVDVLFDDNVAGESLVEHPVADACFARGHPFLVMTVEVVGEIETLAQRDASNFAGVNPFNDRAITFVISLLKSDMNADFT